MEFSRQEYWSGLRGDLLDPGIEPGSPALQADGLPSEPPRNWSWGKSMASQSLDFFFVKMGMTAMPPYLPGSPSCARRVGTVLMTCKQHSAIRYWSETKCKRNDHLQPPLGPEGGVERADLGSTEDANKMTGSTLRTAVRRAKRSHGHVRFVLRGGMVRLLGRAVGIWRMGLRDAFQHSRKKP